MLRVGKHLTRHVVVLLLALLLASTVASSPSQPRSAFRPAAVATRALSDPLSPKDRVEVFEEVWGTISEKYYDPSFNGIDWRAVHGRYRPTIHSATTDE